MSALLVAIGHLLGVLVDIVAFTLAIYHHLKAVQRYDDALPEAAKYHERRAVVWLLFCIAGSLSTMAARAPR